MARIKLNKSMRIYLGSLSVLELMGMTQDLCKGCEDESCDSTTMLSCGFYQVPRTGEQIYPCDVKTVLSDLLDGMIDSLDKFYINK